MLQFLNYFFKIKITKSVKSAPRPSPHLKKSIFKADDRKD